MNKREPVELTTAQGRVLVVPRDVSSVKERHDGTFIVMSDSRSAYLVNEDYAEVKFALYGEAK